MNGGQTNLLTALALGAAALTASVTGCELISAIDRSVLAAGGNGGEGGTGGALCVVADCPPPSAACEEAVCNADGTCGTENAAAGTDCTAGGKVCDGAGKCVECNDAATDCPAPADECTTATCTAGACGTSFAADGTATTAGQLPGDCKKQVCDGAGATKIIDDDDPMDDGNDCTMDMCVAGVNTPVNQAPGFACNDNGGNVCGAGGKVGTCVECLTNADCTVAPMTTCDINGENFLCVTGESCPDGVKNGLETDVDCGGGGFCGTCANTKMCGVDADCTSGFCNGGVCKPCANDADCDAVDYCNAGVCTPDQPIGAACASASQCGSNFCVDSVCCDAACGGACQACTLAKKGSGSDGTCGFVAAGADPDAECAGALNCDGAGACQLGIGAACSAGSQCGSTFCTDGVCCNGACNGTCQACTAALKGAGSNGACGNMGEGRADAACAAPVNACNGAGACLLGYNQVCTANGQCASNRCDTVGTGLCQCASDNDCTTAGVAGTCNNGTKLCQ